MRRSGGAIVDRRMLLPQMSLNLCLKRLIVTISLGALETTRPGGSAAVPALRAKPTLNHITMDSIHDRHDVSLRACVGMHAERES